MWYARSLSGCRFKTSFHNVAWSCQTWFRWYGHRKAKYHFVAPKYSTIPDSSIVLTDADFKKYYDEHKEDYKQEASVDIDYVIWEFNPSLEDRQTIDAYVNELYTEMQQTENVINFVTG